MQLPVMSDNAVQNRELIPTLARGIEALKLSLGDQSPLVAALLGLSDRIEHQRLQLAILGQFKRGKSSLINALLGASVLPTAVIPLTAIGTFIAWRPEPLVRIHFKDKRAAEECLVSDVAGIRDFLFRFVAEEANPENRLDVTRVELFYPAAILRNGTVLIDSPGVGSTLQHNTNAALRVLPESDAALFVLSVDPPITEVEIEYLRRVRSKTARVFFILNKVDYVPPDERHKAVEFLQKVLSERSLLDSAERIFCVSARDGLAAKNAGDSAKLQESGIADLETHLLRRLAAEKTQWLETAIRTRATGILSEARAELALRAQTLTMPVDELGKRAHAFEEALRSIAEQRRITRDLLAGDHRRLRDALECRIDDLRRDALSKLTRIIETELSAATATGWQEAAQRAFSEMMERVFENGRDLLTSAFSRETNDALSSFQERIENLVNSVRRTAAQIFEVSFPEATEHEEFQLGEDPYWITQSIGSTLIPDPGRLLDGFLPSTLRRARLRRRILQEADQLIVRNAENLRWAILRGLDDTFRKAAAQFEQRLDQAIAATQGVIEDAVARRRDRSLAVGPDVDRLNSAIALLDGLRQEMAHNATDQVAPGLVPESRDRPLVQSTTD
jgi:GTP-binding protein EngB required for normal cell division